MKRRTMAFGGLLMAVAITGYSVAGTYAKYISSIDHTDQARVAKWDFRSQSTNTVDLFEASYTNDDGVYVASKDAAKVIAPGTSGEYSYSIAGTAETNFKISGSTKIVNKVILATGANDWNKGTLLYDPVQFDLGNGTYKTLSELGATVSYDDNGNAQLVYELKGDSSIVYPAKYELKAKDVSGTIKWKWAFDKDEASHIVDTLDTKLGTDVVENENLTITATISTSVEQTKEAPTTGRTEKPITLSNRLDRVAAKAEDNQKGIAAYGMNTADYKDVFFNGVKLTGTMNKNTNALATNMFGDMASGYYYAFVVSEDAARVEFTGKVQGGKNFAAGEVKTLGWNNVEAGAALPIGLYNDTDKSARNFTITIKNAEGTVIQTINVDYSDLVMAN